METREDIGSLNATTKAIGMTLERLGTVLEKISAQGAAIETLAKGQSVLFDRVREVELKAEGERVRVGAIMSGISVIISGVTAYVFNHLKGQ